MEKTACLKYFGFERADERFTPGVVVGIGMSGQALLKARLGQELAEGAAAILATPVAVENETGDGSA